MKKKHTYEHGVSPSHLFFLALQTEQAAVCLTNSFSTTFTFLPSINSILSAILKNNTKKENIKKWREESTGREEGRDEGKEMREKR